MTPPVRPTVVFPAATWRGGVERVVWESLRHLGRNHPTTFVGYRAEHAARLGVTLRTPRPPRWAIGALGPVGFRTAARACLPCGPGVVTISHGVDAPPGDVRYVHSVHRAWLAAGGPARVRAWQVPPAVRYLLPRHHALLALEYDYFRRHPPRAVVAVSGAVVDDLERLYGVSRAKVHVIPNGFDPHQCSPTRRAELRSQRRQHLGIAEDTTVLLFVANELHRKGLAVLLDAVAALGDQAVQVHVVGRAPLGDFAPQIARRGLERRVVHHGATDDIGQFHAIADVLVLPTQYEAFALTVVEALASGLPVITTDVPGARDRVVHDRNGLLLQDPLDSHELRGLLERALEPSCRARWSDHAPSAVVDLTWHALMGRLEQLVVEVA